MTDQRERIAQHFANRRVSGIALTPNENDYAEADALIAAGFGDVAAEQAESASLATMLDTAHVDLDLLENRLELESIRADKAEARIAAALDIAKTLTSKSSPLAPSTARTVRTTPIDIGPPTN